MFDRLYDIKNGETPWSQSDLEKLAGRNLIRVFQSIEQVRDSLSSEFASDAVIAGNELFSAQKEDEIIPGSCQTANE